VGVVLAAPASAAPPVTTGLVVSLSADAVDPADTTQVRIAGADTFVKQWNDQSGNSHSATNATEGDQPQYIASGADGQPVLRFAQRDDDNGSRLYLGDLSEHTPSAGSVYIVSTIDNDGRYNLFGNCGNDERWVADSWNESRPGSFRSGRSEAGSFTLSDWPTTGSHVFALENGSTATFRVVIDGSEIGTDSANYNSGSGQNWTIGNRATNGQQLRGDIAEVLIYDRVLSLEEADMVGGYLTLKYNLITAYPPLGLTVKLASPTHNQEFISGTSITASASVIAGTGPYTVEFFVDDVLKGTATTTDPYTRNLGVLANGSHTVYAKVTDSTLATATSDINSILVAAATPTTTALDTSASPSTYGQSVTFTATVSPPPSGGTVQFYDDGDPLGSPVTVSTSTGMAQCSTSLLAVATHSITAHYSGFGIYLASDATALSQSVDPALLTVTADNKMRTPGTSNPDLTYKITGYQNGEDLGTSGVEGEAVLNTSAGIASPVGSYDITCDQGSLAAANYIFTTVKGTLTIQVGAPPVSNGMVCWYDASSITVADGSQVTTWNDLSGNGHTATRANGAPVISYGDIKYNSSDAPKKGVHFRGTDDWFDCAGGMFVKEQYVVVRSPNPTWVGSGSFLGRKSADFLTVRASSHNLFSGYTGFWDDELPAAVSRNGAVVSNAAGSMPRGGFELGPITDYMIVKIVVNDRASAANRAAYPYYQIGRTETLTGVEMDIAEIIGYEATLSAEDEAVLGAYLAEKYGVVTTYPETTPQALIRSFAATGMPSTLDQARRTVVISVTIGTDVSTLVPTFSLSEGAACTVDGSPLVSDSTPLNLTGPPVHCIVTSSDGLITTDYAVTVKYVSTVTAAGTDLNVAADGTGLEILNDGLLVEANHFGQSGAGIGMVTVNGVEFSTSWAHMTSGWNTGGQWTNTDSQNLVPSLDDTTDFGKLMRNYIWTGATNMRVDIPGLTPGHSYRLQWITSSPRGGNISVEGSPSVALAPNSVPPRVFAFTWVATDTTANVFVTRQAGNYGGQDSEVVFNGYALHDMGVAVAGAIISGVTAGQSVPVGTTAVTLGGTVSDGGTVYPAPGEAVSVTIHGVTEYAIVGSKGAFSLEFPTASLVGGAYPITYGYAGNWVTLAAAPNDTSTTLSISGPALISNVTPNPTRVVGAPTVTLSGTVSGGTAYPAAGELVDVTINGVTQPASIVGTAGAFSLAFPMASIPVGTHTITYSYAGNGILLTAAPNNTSTKLTVIATASTAYKSLVLASAPVSYWPLNETSGTTALDIVGTNNITYGGTSPLDYKLNQEPLRNTDGQPCALFTSGNSQAAYNSSLNPSQFTVECWVKPTNTAAVQYLVSLQDRTAGGRLGYALWKVNGSAGFGVMAGTGTGSNGVAVNGATVAEAGKTYHVVGTYDGTTLKLYVNGNLEGAASLVYVPATPNQPGFSVGSRNGATVSPSYIQDVALYNRALTAEEILTHYQGAATTGYGSWATTYAGGQAANLDYNKDGVQNGIAYFMGKNGLATNPGVVGGKVTWPHVNAVASFGVEVSSNLVNWSPATTGVDTSDPSKVVFTLPTGAGKKFCRLMVVP
jgi:hypothetical protein